MRLHIQNNIFHFSSIAHPVLFLKMLWSFWTLGMSPLRALEVAGIMPREVRTSASLTNPPFHPFMLFPSTANERLSFSHVMQSFGAPKTVCGPDFKCWWPLAKLSAHTWVLHVTSCTAWMRLAVPLERTWAQALEDNLFPLIFLWRSILIDVY